MVYGFGTATARVIELRHADDLREKVAFDVTRQIQRSGLPEHPIIVRPLDSTWGGLEETLTNWLDWKGADVHVDEGLGHQFGESRVAKPSEVREIWYTAVGGAYRSLMSERTGARLVAHTTPFKRSVEQEAIRLQRRLDAQLGTSSHPELRSLLDSEFLAVAVVRDHVGNVSLDDARRLSHLNAVVNESGHCRCSVWALPAQTAPNRRALRQQVLGS